MGRKRSYFHLNVEIGNDVTDICATSVDDATTVVETYAIVDGETLEGNISYCLRFL